MDPQKEKKELEKRKSYIRLHSDVCPPTTNKEVYLLKLEEIGTCKLDPNKKYPTRKFQFGTPTDSVCEKTILLLGETGTGKSTMINATINYIFGVEWADDFRVKLIPDETQSQAHSQTSGITSYTIYPKTWFKIPYTLTIVDTPGFGDTSGVKRDNEITEQIKEFFSTKGDGGLDHITAVGFVVKASSTRFTKTQSYVFDNILKLFGKDIQENFIHLFTYAQAGKPQALEALVAADIQVSKSFKFSNLGIFGKPILKDSTEDDEDEASFDMMSKIAWRTGNDNFQKLLKALEITEDKSLVLTKSLMEKRESLQAQVEDINKQIMISVSMAKVLDTEMDLLKRNKEAIDKNQPVTYTVKVSFMKLVEIPYKDYCANNCGECKKTCHIPCSKFWGSRLCTVTYFLSGTCSVCGHQASLHSISRQSYVCQEREETRTLQELKDKLISAEGRYQTQEELVKCQVEQIEKTYDLILSQCLRAKECRESIQKIALKSNPLSIIGYLDMLIEAAKEENPDDLAEQVKYLNEVKKNALLIDQYTADGYDPEKDKKKLMQTIKDKYKEQVDKCSIN